MSSRNDGEDTGRNASSSSAAAAAAAAAAARSTNPSAASRAGIGTWTTGGGSGSGGGGVGGGLPPAALALLLHLQQQEQRRQRQRSPAAAGPPPRPPPAAPAAGVQSMAAANHFSRGLGQRSSTGADLPQGNDDGDTALLGIMQQLRQLPTEALQAVLAAANGFDTASGSASGGRGGGGNIATELLGRQLAGTPAAAATSGQEQQERELLLLLQRRRLQEQLSRREQQVQRYRQLEQLEQVVQEQQEAAAAEQLLQRLQQQRQRQHQQQQQQYHHQQQQQHRPAALAAGLVLDLGAPAAPPAVVAASAGAKKAAALDVPHGMHASSSIGGAPGASSASADVLQLLQRLLRGHGGGALGLGEAAAATGKRSLAAAYAGPLLDAAAAGGAVETAGVTVDGSDQNTSSSRGDGRGEGRAAGGRGSRGSGSGSGSADAPAAPVAAEQLLLQQLAILTRSQPHLPLREVARASASAAASLMRQDAQAIVASAVAAQGQARPAGRGAAVACASSAAAAAIAGGAQSTSAVSGGSSSGDGCAAVGGADTSLHEGRQAAADALMEVPRSVGTAARAGGDSSDVTADSFPTVADDRAAAALAASGVGGNVQQTQMVVELLLPDPSTADAAAQAGQLGAFCWELKAPRFCIDHRYLQTLFDEEAVAVPGAAAAADGSPPTRRAYPTCNMRICRNGAVLPDTYVDVYWEEGPQDGVFTPTGLAGVQLAEHLQGCYLQGFRWLDAARTQLVAVAWDQPPPGCRLLGTRRILLGTANTILQQASTAEAEGSAGAPRPAANSQQRLQQQTGPLPPLSAGAVEGRGLHGDRQRAGAASGEAAAVADTVGKAADEDSGTAAARGKRPAAGPAAAAEQSEPWQGDGAAAATMAAAKRIKLEPASASARQPAAGTATVDAGAQDAATATAAGGADAAATSAGTRAGGVQGAAAGSSEALRRACSGSDDEPRSDEYHGSDSSGSSDASDADNDAELEAEQQEREREQQQRRQQRRELAQRVLPQEQQQQQGARARGMEGSGGAATAATAGGDGTRDLAALLALRTRAAAVVAEERVGGTVTSAAELRALEQLLRLLPASLAAIGAPEEALEDPGPGGSGQAAPQQRRVKPLKLYRLLGTGDEPPIVVDANSRDTGGGFARDLSGSALVGAEQQRCRLVQLRLPEPLEGKDQGEQQLRQQVLKLLLQQQQQQAASRAACGDASEGAAAAAEAAVARAAASLGLSATAMDSGSGSGDRQHLRPHGLDGSGQELVTIRRSAAADVVQSAGPAVAAAGVTAQVSEAGTVEEQLQLLQQQQQRLLRLQQQERQLLAPERAVPLSAETLALPLSEEQQLIRLQQRAKEVQQGVGSAAAGAIGDAGPRPPQLPAAVLQQLLFTSSGQQQQRQQPGHQRPAAFTVGTGGESPGMSGMSGREVREAANASPLWPAVAAFDRGGVAGLAGPAAATLQQVSSGRQRVIPLGLSGKAVLTTCDDAPLGAQHQQALLELQASRSGSSPAGRQQPTSAAIAAAVARGATAGEAGPSGSAAAAVASFDGAILPDPAHLVAQLHVGLGLLDPLATAVGAAAANSGGGDAPEVAAAAVHGLLAGPHEAEVEELEEPTSELLIRTLPWISMHVARSWYPGSCEGPEYVPFPVIVAIELDGVLLPGRYPAHLKPYPCNNSVFVPGLPVKMVKGLVRVGWRRLRDRTLVLQVRTPSGPPAQG